MALLTAELSKALWARGCWFSVGNPATSFIWCLPEFVELGALAGVTRVVFSNCMYADGKRPKRTAIVSNIPGIMGLARLC